MLANATPFGLTCSPPRSALAKQEAESKDEMTQLLAHISTASLFLTMFQHPELLKKSVVKLYHLSN